MTDTELLEWWPDLGALVSELRRIDRDAVADLIIDAVCAGATSGEIFCSVGVVLHDYRRVRSELDDSGMRAWDAVMAEIGVYPGS
ncbi:MAG: hypothetical protein HQM09_24610 [Candidatus Riflebacteria bacterium]|nr:hypothetical protein [Candidatus Riflebacteria bacterium]